LLLLDATPTSYYASSEPYSVRSILAGRAIYAANCVTCHGESGQGDGPASASLAIAPADLTAHLFVHTEGDLFWFIGNGMDDGVMPPFRDVLAESQRWSLINFLKARAARVEANPIGAAVTDAPAPQAPDFSFTDADGVATTLAAALTQRAVLLVLGEAPPSPRLAQLEEWRSVLAESGVALVTSNDPDLQGVYESFDRRRVRDDRPIEVLIDHDGNIRALARPGDTPDWSDLAVLTRQIDTLARLKIARRSQAAHVHTIN
jgi:mono/diheme cytochrome c family protein